MNTFWRVLAHEIGAATGQSFALRQHEPVGGGCIHQAWRVSDGDRTYFVKINDAAHLPLFEAEAAGSAELAATATVRVPAPLGHRVAAGRAYLVLECLPLGGSHAGAMERLGRQLAALHAQPQAGFGGHRDNFIGATSQPNPPGADWIAFWREHRLGFQLALAARHGYGGVWLRRGEALRARLAGLFAGYQPLPSLLHGDLWGGNAGCTRDGEPVVFDPAVYAGDREADLAMTEWFGGFSDRFYAAYRETLPLAAGYPPRRTLYNLYHVLHHLNLFGGVVVALTGIHWREAWKYGLRAYRYGQHDGGHAIAAIAYAAAALGWRAQLLPGWGDAELAAVLGLDRMEDFADAEPESPEVALWVGPEPPPADLSLKGLSDGLCFVGCANRLSHDHRHWPGIEEVDQAAQRPTMTPPPACQAPSRPPLAASGCPARAATLIRQRRSAVAFDGVTRLPADRWFGMLDALLPRPAVPPLEAWPWPPRVHPLLFAHRIAGVPPGLYLLVRDAAARAALREALHGEWAWSKVAQVPDHLPLYPLAAGDARAAARVMACHQAIAADSCFAVGFLTEFAGPLEGSPWVYRELFWETGLLGQILYLEAEAAGVRATGIGCFFDDAVHRRLGLDGLAWQLLYHFTVGGPVEDSRVQTLPPYAHRRRDPAEEPGDEAVPGWQPQEAR